MIDVIFKRVRRLFISAVVLVAALCILALALFLLTGLVVLIVTTISFLGG